MYSWICHQQNSFELLKCCSYNWNIPNKRHTHTNNKNWNASRNQHRHDQRTVFHWFLFQLLHIHTRTFASTRHIYCVCAARMIGPISNTIIALYRFVVVCVFSRSPILPCVLLMCERANSATWWIAHRSVPLHVCVIRNIKWNDMTTDKPTDQIKSYDETVLIVFAIHLFRGVLCVSFFAAFFRSVCLCALFFSSW